MCLVLSRKMLFSLPSISDGYDSYKPYKNSSPKQAVRLKTNRLTRRGKDADDRMEEACQKY